MTPDFEPTEHSFESDLPDALGDGALLLRGILDPNQTRYVRYRPSLEGLVESTCGDAPEDYDPDEAFPSLEFVEAWLAAAQAEIERSGAWK